MKVLYESVIAPDTRHRLGEYYTPDWLAAAMVEKAVDDPLQQRVLDPACGSGTFLFQAVRVGRHLPLRGRPCHLSAGHRPYPFAVGKSASVQRPRLPRRLNHP
jgi:hypothetical protein